MDHVWPHRVPHPRVQQLRLRHGNPSPVSFTLAAGEVAVIEVALLKVNEVAAVLLHQMTDVYWVAEVRMIALGATMVLTVVSGFHYAWMVSRRIGVPVIGSPGAR